MLYHFDNKINKYRREECWSSRWDTPRKNTALNIYHKSEPKYETIGFIKKESA